MRGPMQTLNALGDMEDSILEMCMVLKSETVQIFEQYWRPLKLGRGLSGNRPEIQLLEQRDFGFPMSVFKMKVYIISSVETYNTLVSVNFILQVYFFNVSNYNATKGPISLNSHL